MEINGKSNFNFDFYENVLNRNKSKMITKDNRDNRIFGRKIHKILEDHKNGKIHTQTIRLITEKSFLNTRTKELPPDIELEKSTNHGNMM